MKRKDNKVITIQLKDFKNLKYKDKLYIYIIIDVVAILINNYNKFFYKL